MAPVAVNARNKGERNERLKAGKFANSVCKVDKTLGPAMFSPTNAVFAAWFVLRADHLRHEKCFFFSFLIIILQLQNKKYKSTCISSHLMTRMVFVLIHWSLTQWS